MSQPIDQPVQEWDGLLGSPLSVSTDGEGTWLEYQHFWLFMADQKSDAWIKVRGGHVSGSTCANCCGFSPYETPYSEAEYASGCKRKQFDQVAMGRMNRGTEREPRVRDWFIRKTGLDIVELPFAVDKAFPFIGVSVDGIGHDRVIEIKAPDTLYPALIDYVNGVKTDINKTYWANVLPHLTLDQVRVLSEMAHINPCHVCQMYLGMYVTKRTRATYIVYSENSNQVFTQDLVWNQWLWDLVLFPRIRYYVHAILVPLLKGMPFTPGPLRPLMYQLMGQTVQVVPVGFPTKQDKVTDFNVSRAMSEIFTF